MWTVRKKIRSNFIPKRYLSVNLWEKDIDKEMKFEMEKFWSSELDSTTVFNRSGKQKRYILCMFPYPSGKLHMGHVRVYTISDTLARFHRMLGENVFHPIGWDAFGLPAENAAFEHNVHPADWTERNIEQMKEQLKTLRFSFNWDYEISTCSPHYYKWTQFILLKLYEAGLLYRKQEVLNWDPVDKTVLADEQIDENGCSWRSGAKVEKKILKQWFVKTTVFAKDLRDGLNEDVLIDWRDIIDLQKNWIGECDGYSFDFKVIDENNVEMKETVLNIWTLYPERVPSASCIIVSPGSVWDILSADECGTERRLKITALNPFSNTIVPIYVSDKAPFPTGRDSYLCTPTVSINDKDLMSRIGAEKVSCMIGSSDSYSRSEICEKARNLRIGGYPVSSKLKDWLVSRQRYWGTPIPLIHCSSCGIQPVRYDDLPVTLPVISKSEKSFKRADILKNSNEWLETTCPKCGSKALREIDTIDTFVDSSWYFLRYLDPKNLSHPFDFDFANSMMPVDIYVGGKEHAILHLYYARFMAYFLHSIGWIKQREPFTRLLTQGMIMGKTYKSSTGQYLRPSQICSKGKKITEKDSGKPVQMSWEKMSKSKYNGVDPEDVLSEYGIDTTRLIMLFSVAPFSHRHWNSDLFNDVLVWQHRLWLTLREFLNVRTNELTGHQIAEDDDEEERELWACRNYNVYSVTYKYTTSHQLASLITDLQQITTSLRKCSRSIRKYCEQYQRLLAIQIIMLAPIAPHFAATLWYGFTAAPNRLKHCDDEISWDKNVLMQKWPEIDPNYGVPLNYKANDGRLFSLYLLKNHSVQINVDSVVSLISKYFKPNQKDLDTTKRKYSLINSRTMVEVKHYNIDE